MRVSSDGTIALEPGEVLGPIERECEHELSLIAGDAVIVIRWLKRCGWTRAMRMVYGKALLAPASPKTMMVMFPGDAYQVTAGREGAVLSFSTATSQVSPAWPVADWNPPEELLDAVVRGGRLLS